VKVLLDTHALLWWLTDDRRLSRRARKVIADPKSTVLVSSASAWEMATKLRLGKLRDPDGAVPRLPAILLERGLVELPVTVAHAIEAGLLPAQHRDPFDRMLAAQSRSEGAPLVTNDPAFGDYGIRIVW
jgi:PIN domain nuclease of toxin-antitoxin system